MNPNSIIILADERDNINDHAAKLGDLEFITKVMENKLLISNCFRKIPLSFF